MPQDIRPFGDREGISGYWISTGDSLGDPYLLLVAIDELGEVIELPMRHKHDPAAPSRGQAVAEHLSALIAEADADLERRRAEKPQEPPQPRPALQDEATRRFFTDYDG